ncbi:MAG: hypothetical protein GX190_03340 [Mollicutes bacterium]|nr:hypothetical protein [Mollicutes bacterium]
MDKKLKELTIIQKIGLLAQTLFTLAILIVLFWSIGVPELMRLVKELLIILFLVMAFNNHVLYKRKGFTVFNIIAALLILVSVLTE